MIRSQISIKWPLLAPIVFMALFYFFPLTQIFHISFRPQGRWDLSGFGKLFTQTYYLKTLWFTFWQASLSTVLTLMLAIPCAYLFARFEFKSRKALATLVMIPFVLPTVVVAAAFDALIGPNGWVNEMLMHFLKIDKAPIQMTHSLAAILMAHVFFNTSLAMRIISGFWSLLPPGMEEAARMLGASRASVFMRITLPLLRPAIFSAALLVFLFCFSSFGVILILGGPRFATLEVEIYRQALHLFNLPMAAVLSLVQILFTFLLMGIYTWLQRHRPDALAAIASGFVRSKPRTWGQKIFAWTVIFVVLIFFGLPISALLITSFLNDSGFSLVFYKALFINASQSIFFIPPLAAMANSLSIAAVTMILATLIGLCAAVYLAGEKSCLTVMLDPLFMLPLSTSAVTLGFGFILALDKPPLNLRDSFWIVPLAHCLVAFPFVVRSVLPAIRSIPPTLKEAAQVLGAGPWRLHKTVTFPIIGRAIAVGALFAFTISLGEFGATAFVARPQTATLPLAIYRFLGQPGAMNYGQALAMSSLLMLTSAMGFLLLERMRGSTLGEF